MAVWMEARFFKEEIWLTAEPLSRFIGSESLHLAQDPMIFGGGGGIFKERRKTSKDGVHPFQKLV